MSRGKTPDWTPRPKKESRFMRQIRRGAERIVKEAGGRTCGGCVFFTGSSCGIHISAVTGNALEIRTPDAPACSDWEAIH